MVLSVPTAMPLKSKLSEAGDKACFRKTSFIGGKLDG